MQDHLSLERLAALADEPATLPERTHLAQCVQCTAELSAAQRLVRMALTDTPTIERPMTSWDRLAPALRSEGLITTPSGVGGAEFGATSMVSARQWRMRRALQVAAGIFLAVGGAVVGRASAGATDAAGPAVAAATPTPADTNFRSTSDAINVLQHASNDYQRAVAYLATNDSSVMLNGRDAAEVYQARLDAIDKSVAATRAALYRAPQDPVLNNYYLQSVGARNLTLRQMGGAVPVALTKRTKF
jgi:hypothetical protein